VSPKAAARAAVIDDMSQTSSTLPAPTRTDREMLESMAAERRGAEIARARAAAFWAIPTAARPAVTEAAVRESERIAAACAAATIPCPWAETTAVLADYDSQAPRAPHVDEDPEALVIL
jgi:hypothetical protein